MYLQQDVEFIDSDVCCGPARDLVILIFAQGYGEDDSPISKRSLQTGDAGSVRKTT